MKAMQFGAFGGLNSLRAVDLPEPVPQTGEVLVEVATTSVNPIDWKLRSGALRWISPLRYSRVPCFDFAGTVVALGPQAERYRIGDRVFGMRPLRQTGAAAERVASHIDHLAAIPHGISYEQAAGVPLAGMTALQTLLRPTAFGPGEKILIVGASGGVGHYAVQIAKTLQSHATAVCSTPNVDWVRQLGADAVLDYTRGETAAPRPEFDRVVDAVSLGRFQRWRQWLKPGGVYVTLLPRLDLLWHRLMPPRGSNHRSEVVWLKPNLTDLNRLAAWMAEGRLRTIIDDTFPLDALTAAFERSSTGHARGKIIVRIPA